MEAHEVDDTKLRLKKTIYSSFNAGYVYGRKGDEVKLINRSDNVCIVEDEKGNKFPILLEDLTGLIIEKTEAAPDDTAAPNKTITHRAPVSKKKAAPINQTTLF